MPFPIIYSDEFLEHLTGLGHPEKPQRLTAIADALHSSPFADQLEWKLPTSVEQRDVMPLLLKIHDPEYVQKIAEISKSGGGYLDSETAVCPRSYEVALLAVNAWLDGVDLVLETEKPSFILARPPGHHAERETGMGFCLFSNAAIASVYALSKFNVNRVAILDWDVHHGNGTQAIVETNPQIIYCSLHQYPCYPGTGKHTERGFHQNVLNLPIPPGSNITTYKSAFERFVVPFIQGFNPDLLIVSAGYDANAADKLAQIKLQPEDYGLLTECCLGITSKIVFGLEGGYDLDALGQSVVATIGKCLHVGMN
jgi:acetoin utilization deacetylase AcuC-like enzyme